MSWLGEMVEGIDRDAIATGAQLGVGSDGLFYLLLWRFEREEDGLFDLDDAKALGLPEGTTTAHNFTLFRLEDDPKGPGGKNWAYQGERWMAPDEAQSFYEEMVTDQTDPTEARAAFAAFHMEDAL